MGERGDTEDKGLAQSAASRGKVEAGVLIQTVDSPDVQVAVNTALARAYVDALRQMGEELGLGDDLTVSTVARLGDICTLRRAQEDEDGQRQPCLFKNKHGCRSSLNCLCLQAPPGAPHPVRPLKGPCRYPQQRDRLHLPGVQPYPQPQRHGERGTAADLPGGRPPLLPKPPEDVHDVRPGAFVQVAGGLVGQDETQTV